MALVSIHKMGYLCEFHWISPTWIPRNTIGWVSSYGRYQSVTVAPSKIFLTTCSCSRYISSFQWNKRIHSYSLSNLYNYFLGCFNTCNSSFPARWYVYLHGLHDNGLLVRHRSHHLCWKSLMRQLDTNTARNDSQNWRYLCWIDWLLVMLEKKSWFKGMCR